MPKLVAKVAFTYANRSLQPGDAFEASDKDARVLRLINRAEDAGAPAPAAKAPPAVEQLDLNQSGTEQSGSDEPKRGRRYQRRDMTAGE